MRIDFRLARLRSGEWVAAASAGVLLVLLFGPSWFSRSIDGWRGLSWGRWVIVVTIVAALALAGLQASRRSPAIPVTMSVFVTVLGLLSVVWLLFRVAIDPPGHRNLAAYLGLLAGCALSWGGFLSMRREGISPDDAPTDIPVISLDARTGA